MKINIPIWLVAAVLLLLAKPVNAQESTIGLGNWQTHLPYNNARSVAEVGDRIYCATENGFFYYDKTYNNTRVLSKTDGFADTRISKLAYDPQTQTLLIAYRNTNIDLLRNGQIININDIFRKTLTGEKAINHVYFHNKIAYLSCSFGMVLLDLVKLEIKDTYGNLGTNGEALKVYSATILNDSLFLATANGLMAGNTKTNLLDFKRWKRYSTTNGLPANNPSEPFRTVATFQGQVYAGINNHSLMRYQNNGKWEWSGLGNVGDFLSLNPTASQLLATSNLNFILYENYTTQHWNDDKWLIKPQETIKSSDGTFWVADNESGLVHFIVPDHPDNQVFMPNGPAYIRSFRVYSDDKSVFVLGGGYLEGHVQSDNFSGFYEYQNGTWTNYNVNVFPNPRDYPEIQYLVDMVRNPVNNKLYIGSFGYGLLEWEGPGKYKLYNSLNSPLRSEYANTDTTYVRITGVEADEKGSIWMVNRVALRPGSPGLYELKLDGTMVGYPMPGISQGHNLERLVIDDNGYKWMTLANNQVSEIAVFDEKTNKTRYLTQSPTGGNLPAGGIKAIVKDNRGEIWIGTSTGIGVFYNPHQVFSATNFNANRPIIELRPLLDGQVVRCIAIDGGNRKWIGTDNGVWLFSENGDEALLHFTTKNSPLLSDQITDIGINHATGEVFIGTQAGMISYRSGATITREEPQCAKVFPNPVRPGFSGLVGIADLPNNAVVKITDIAGKLVFETKANGGTATWNLTDYNGKRVRSGVYVVMSATADGSQNCVSKIAVVE